MPMILLSREPFPGLPKGLKLYPRSLKEMQSTPQWHEWSQGSKLLGLHGQIACCFVMGVSIVLK